MANETILQREVQVEDSPLVMGFTIQSYVQKGWTIDPDMPVAQTGFKWECGFIRNATPEQLAEDAIEAAKPSPQERMAHARAVRAEKAAQKAQQGGA